MSVVRAVLCVLCYGNVVCLLLGQCCVSFVTVMLCVYC